MDPSANVEPSADGLAPRVTVVIPNWNTGPLLRLCLSSLLRFARVPRRVVVVDNGSSDASRRTAEGAAAAGLITLLRRDDATGAGADDHGAALDAGLAACETPLLFTLDSDAWVRRDDWLDAYIEALADDRSHAGASKFPGGRIKRLWAWTTRQRSGPEAGYVRPCHALYRRRLLVEGGLSFAPRRGADGVWQTTGEGIHEDLVALGHQPAFMPHGRVAERVGHLRHATFVLNAARFPALRARARRRGEAQIRALLASREASSILEGSQVP